MSGTELTSAGAPELEPARSLTRSTLALHANTILTAALGFGFLIVAARLYDRDALGRDMALISTMTMLAAIAETNAGMALVRFLPRLGVRSAQAVVRAIVITSTIALVPATAFVVIAPQVSDNLSYIHDTKGLAALFVLTVICWNAFAICDAVLIAVRGASWVPVKNVTFGVAKFAVMIVLVHSTFQHGIFLSWVIPILFMVIPTVWLIFTFPLRRHMEAEAPAELSEDSTPIPQGRQMLRYLGLDSLASTLSQIGLSALPLVVLVTLGASENAEFAVAFAIVLAVEQFSVNAGTALTAEGAFDESSFARLVRHSFVRFGGLLTVMVLIGVAAAPIATFAYGDQYGSDTTMVLRLLLIGLIPEAVVIFYESISRARAEAERVVAVNATQCVVTLGLAIVLSEPFGLAGIGYAWIAGHTVVAIAVLPSMLRMMFPRTKETA